MCACACVCVRACVVCLLLIRYDIYIHTHKRYFLCMWVYKDAVCMRVRTYDTYVQMCVCVCLCKTKPRCHHAKEHIYLHLCIRLSYTCIHTYSPTCACMHTHQHDKITGSLARGVSSCVYIRSLLYAYISTHSRIRTYIHTHQHCKSAGSLLFVCQHAKIT